MLDWLVELAVAQPEFRADSNRPAAARFEVAMVASLSSLWMFAAVVVRLEIEMKPISIGIWMEFRFLFEIKLTIDVFDAHGIVLRLML